MKECRYCSNFVEYNGKSDKGSCELSGEIKQGNDKGCSAYTVIDDEDDLK